jgi:hypothetical protein
MLLVCRFLKVLSVALLFSGSIGAVLARDFKDRQRFAYAIAGPGFGLTWALGFMLAWLTGVSLMSWWIMGALALSFVSLQGVLYVAGKDGRRGAGAAIVILAPLVATVALMIWRPE